MLSEVSSLFSRKTRSTLRFQIKPPKISYKSGNLFLAKRGRRPRVAGFIILSLKGLRRDEISCGVYGHVYLFIYLSVRLVCAGNDVTRPRAGGLMV